MEPRQQSDEPTPPAEAPPHAVPEQRDPPRLPTGGPSPTQPAAPRRGRRLGRFKAVLLVLAGVLALLCVGGIGVVFVLYDQATKPDRSAPDVVVDNYLRALLVDRNDTQAKQYVCADESALGPIAGLRGEAERREREFDVVVRVSWGALNRTAVNDREEIVRTELVIAGFADGQQRSRRSENWEFRVVDEDGWRVCGARLLS